MNLYEHQARALETESIIEKVIANKTELDYVLGAFITITEMMDCLKKKIYYGKDTKYNEQFHELAERLHYMTTCCDRHHDIQEATELSINPRVFHAILGIATESGELGSALLNAINGHELDAINTMEEFGDIAWYLAIGHHALELDPEKTLDVNIKKLTDKKKGRFKDGFTQEEADNRNLEAERSILEGN
jgi:NTP pyrophosphatase (non-canonical NTP hydrolase)